MRLDNLPEYPVRPARSLRPALRRQPSFGRFVAGFVGAMVVLGVVLNAITGSGHTRVVTSDRLPGGVLPGQRLGTDGKPETGESSTAPPAPADSSSVPTADPNVPGSLPPTVPPDDSTPAAYLNTLNASGAVVAAATPGRATSKPATNANTGASSKSASQPAPKSTGKPPATTAKPKAAPAPAPAPAPAGTATPKPAPAAATTAKPKQTAPPAPATTAAPKPTAATTAAPEPKQVWSPDEVKALIEQLWPADSLDHALKVAWRESRYRNDVYNGWCCYGVFQINASAHQARLRARGLTTAALYDPKVNIEIAIEIFQEQGWGPWGG